MTAAMRALVPFCFGTLRLHRLEAACIPGNAASVRLLEKTGFQREGYARSYLCINGIWQDHLLYARLKDDARLKSAPPLGCHAWLAIRLACHKGGQGANACKKREPGQWVGDEPNKPCAAVAARSRWSALALALGGCGSHRPVQVVALGLFQLIVESHQRYAGRRRYRQHYGRRYRLPGSANAHRRGHPHDRQQAGRGRAGRDGCALPGFHHPHRPRMSRECRHHDHEGRHRGSRHHRAGRRPRHGRRAAAHRGGAGGRRRPRRSRRNSPRKR